MPITVSSHTEGMGYLCISVFDFRVVLIFIEKSSLEKLKGNDTMQVFEPILLPRETDGLNGIHFGRRFCRRARVSKSNQGLSGHSSG